MPARSIQTMTSEQLYSQQLEDAITTFRTNYTQPLPTYKIEDSIPTGLAELLSFEKTVNSKLSQISSVSIPPLAFDPAKSINEYYDRLDQESSTAKKSIMDAYEQRMRDRTAEHDKHVQDCENHNLSLVRPAQAKHQELLEYKDALEPVWKRYNIEPLDMAISDDITFDEFSTLIDASLAVCEEYLNKQEASKFGKLLNFLKGQEDIRKSGAMVIGLVVVTYLTLPIIAIPAFVVMIKSIHGLYHDLEKLRIARALMAQVDYNRFVNEDDKVTPEELQTADLAEDRDKQLSGVHDYSTERTAALQSATEAMPEISEKLNEVQAEIRAQYAEAKLELERLAMRVQEEKDKIMADYKPFPKFQSDSLVMSHSYVLSKLEGQLDQRTEIPPLNIVFDATTPSLALVTMKLYLANALLSVRVKQLTVEIYDPRNMCEDFHEFLTVDTAQYIKANSMDLSDLMKTYRQYVQENVIALDGKTIDQFNEDAEKRELVPLGYKLLLLISNYQELYRKNDENKLFTEFVKYSADKGVIVWMLGTDKFENTAWVDSKQMASPQIIKYTTELGKEAMATFTDSLKKYKDRGIDYKSKFADKYIPKDKWWSFDTTKGILMPFGLEGGDPTRGLNVAPEMGDANVHAIMGGATGAGKSAAINQLLTSLITLYPPSELQIVLIDFKNVEAAKFTRGYDASAKEWFDPKVEEKYRQEGTYYNRLSRIPHLKIISGTTDGEYALSVFEYLMEEMGKRQQWLNKAGVMKLEDLRKKILKQYQAEKSKVCDWLTMRQDWEWYKKNVYDIYGGDLPRLLVIFDEFQVMYNAEYVPMNVISKIDGKLVAVTKLGRSMGVHLWLTSQSMKGTMSKDTMGNFSLRCALRCAADVSEELLGNSASATITSKFGFMYTNDSAGQNKEANRLWRVPFLDENDMHTYINDLYPLLEERNEFHRMASFYDEKVLVPGKKIMQYYQDYDLFNDPSILILGERATYSTNKAPTTMAFQNDTGENLLISASDRDDFMNLVMTALLNFTCKDPETFELIISCYDKETYASMELDTFVKPQFKPIASPNQDTGALLDAFEGMIAGREQAGDVSSMKPVYIFLVNWERNDIFGGDGDRNKYKYEDRMKEIFRKGPSLGIHFIVCIKNKLSISKCFIQSCQHRLIGLTLQDAFFFHDDSCIEKLPSKDKDAGLFAFYFFGAVKHKVCIYQNKFAANVKQREVVM